MLSVFMLSVFMLSVFMLSVFMLSVFMLILFTLSVFMPNVIMGCHYAWRRGAQVLSLVSGNIDNSSSFESKTSPLSHQFYISLIRPNQGLVSTRVVRVIRVILVC
jgi:hypothetical protein